MGAGAQFHHGDHGVVDAKRLVAPRHDLGAQLGVERLGSRLAVGVLAHNLDGILGGDVVP